MMTQTWYHVGYMWEHDPIKLVEVQRLTESSVWIDGHRRDRKDYFPTFAEAKAELVRRATVKFDGAQRVLESYRKELAKALAVEESA